MLDDKALHLAISHAKHLRLLLLVQGRDVNIVLGCPGRSFVQRSQLPQHVGVHCALSQNVCQNEQLEILLQII